jgi:hypothetical protein
MWSLLLLVPLLVAPAFAQVTGPEFQVNTYTTGGQRYPSVASDAAGNFVVVWQGGSDQDGDSTGIFGQRYESSGAIVGSEFQVNTYTTGVQREPSVAVDGAGNFVVVWQDSGQDGDSGGIFGQRYNSAGAIVGGEFQVNTFTTEGQQFPSVAADVAGNFVAVWESFGLHDGDSAGIFGQRYDSSGAVVGSEFQVNTYTTDSQRYPSVAADVAGNFVVVWSGDDEDGDSYGIFGQRYDSSGAMVGSEFQVNTYTSDSQREPAVAIDGAGNFVVVWRSVGGQDGSGDGIFGQRFASSGAIVGSEFQVNTWTTSGQRNPSLAGDDAGNFVVVWRSGGSQDGSSYGIFGQRYDSAGAMVGSEFQVNTYTTGFQGSASVAADSAGNFVVAWESASDQDGSSYGIFAASSLPQIVPPATTPVPALDETMLVVLMALLIAIGSLALVRRS